MSVNAALALVPELVVLPRDPARERRLLEQQAARALHFTPAVSLVEPDALLLDVHASLKCLGGWTAVQAGVQSAFCQHDADNSEEPCDAGFGYSVIQSSAPTALAALWLARAGRADSLANSRVSPHSPNRPMPGPASDPGSLAGLAGRLATLPIDCFEWPTKINLALRQMGVETFAECNRLPRAGFARRIGAHYLDDLDRALGLQPEVRQFYRPPQHFKSRFELSAETSSIERLLAPVKVLLERLNRFLVRRQGSVQTLWLRLAHLEQPASVLRIGLLRPVTDMAQVHELVRLRLMARAIAAPVNALQLDAGFVALEDQPVPALFGATADQHGQISVLLEQLRLRLGQEAVHGLGIWPEHRPESAWRVVGLDQSRRDAMNVPVPGMQQRPLWMLVEPRALRFVSGQPVLHVPLTLCSDPERIETGWWDDHDIRRDYYVAEDDQGVRYWIYRDCRESRWYLHGLFG